MSLWLVILSSFMQIGFGGLIAMILIFAATSASSNEVSEFHNNVLVSLWFLYCLLVFSSVGFLIYNYVQNGNAASYWWLAVPWAILLFMLGYWKIFSVKLIK